ncbi:ChaN family lipoprotein [Antarctobacter jejuensis]|uniref:ChaN family lipoprotein n=1 Tax=Antarctobacter jejuensis TaxID=1439938 RepID=UPI003FD5A8B6
MKRLILGLLALASPAVAEVPTDADVLFLGEVHDNPGHHARQAEIVSQVQPRAIVWEMLDSAEAGRVTPELIADQAALDAALGWTGSGWPDFAMYYPIFAAAPDAAHYGAEMPRDRARAVMEQGRSSVSISHPGLQALLMADYANPAELQLRLDLQMASHCNALPEDLLPQMVDVQRVRDTLLAAEAAKALEDTGGPVVVITGNGHARRDWGATYLLAAVGKGAVIWALGQAEDGRPAPEGGFDLIESSPPVDREDPCAAFRKD